MGKSGCWRTKAHNISEMWQDKTKVTIEDLRSIYNTFPGLSFD